MSSNPEQKPIIIAKIGKPFGLKGWVRVHSYARPQQKLLQYQNLKLKQESSLKKVKILGHNVIGHNLNIQLDISSTREDAEALTHAFLTIEKSELPPLKEKEFYWRDLIGLEVYNQENHHFGEITSITESAAHDTLIIEKDDKTTLIPFVLDDFIKDVDFENKKITVLWDEDF